MNGCQFEQKSFTVPTATQKVLDLCECGIPITDQTYKVNRRYVCKACWESIPSKGFGAAIDTFNPYYDKQLGCEVSSVRQKVRLLERKGLHYSEDNPKVRELSRLTHEYSRNGKIVATKEFESVSRGLAKRDLHERIDKDIERRYGRKG